MPNDLYTLDTLEVNKIVWDTFAELSRFEKALDSKEYFTLEGFSGQFSTSRSVYEISFNKWKPPQSQVYVAREESVGRESEAHLAVSIIPSLDFERYHLRPFKIISTCS